MELDLRHCPHCQHDVLDWGLKCPGCDQIPRQTEEGKKAMAAARGRWLFADWAWLGLLVVLGYFAVLVFVAGRGHKDLVSPTAATLPAKR